MYAVRTSTSMDETMEGPCAKGPIWTSSTARLTGGLLAVATGCWLGVWFSGQFGLSPLRISATNAILLAALLVAPVRTWWLFLVAVLPSHLYLAAHFQGEGVPHVAMLWQFAAGVFQAVLGALLMRRLVGSPPQLDTLRRVAGFILLAVIAAPAISSTLAADVLTFIRWADDFGSTWRTRFLSNVFTILTVTPLILPPTTW